MEERDTLFSSKVGIALALPLLAFGLFTRNFLVVLLVVGSLMVHLPIPRLTRVLYIGIYFTLAALGVLAYAVLRHGSSMSVYAAAGCLALFGLGGVAAYLHRRNHPDFRQ